MTEPESEFQIPDFDPRRTRRAVRRGVVRTALVSLSALLALVLVATLGSAWVQKRGDRERRMLDVLGTAMQVANPGYRVSVGECCEVSPLSLSFEVGISPIRVVGGFSAGPAFADRRERVTQDFFGRVHTPPLGYGTETPLTYALYNVRTGNQPKAGMRQVLKRLPEDMNALAVVEFTEPMTSAQLVAFARQYGGCPENVVYEDRPRSTPITWEQTMRPRSMDLPKGGMCSDSPPETLEGFRGWVGMLREHDEPNLRRFGLDLARLRKSAAEGRAYAYVDPVSRVSELRKLIEDPRVATVRVADITFDLERPR
ncbi:hypothetical protein FHR32_004161 [Streptosporangium album]|uniref:Uncharacterized protein n=1 Tax=Streptosporangium album TaxID=47479 RepID=A0A7W7WAE1_9ACTN|nr:hypothetical protein [Streptosporangium album]MBB4939856.1 hypothetical protein [Streptosporangium album]